MRTQVVSILAAGLVAILGTLPAAGGIVGLKPGGAGGLGWSQPKALTGGREAMPKHHARPRPWRRHPRRVFVPVYVDRDIEIRETVILPVPVPAARPEPPPEPAPPPDPRGAVALIPARGGPAWREPLGPGSRIAPDVPLVMLDWRLHDLPEPPPGEVWVRLRRQVYRIDPTTRLVRGLAPVPSGTLAEGN